MKPPALETLYEQQLIGVVRAANHESALAAARAIAKGGVSLVEVTFTVPEATRAMAALAATGEAVVGAGTVLTPDECKAALDAGARFIVAPNFSPAVARVALAARVMYVPGAYTTTEIVAARDAGAHVIKVYPVGVAGGLRTSRSSAIRSPTSRCWPRAEPTSRTSSRSCARAAWA